MKAKRTLEDLKLAMRAWNDTACVVVSARTGDYIESVAESGWELVDGGKYLPSHTVKHVWKFGKGLSDIPGFTDLFDAVRASSLVGPMLTEFIGTAIGVSLFNFYRFAQEILPAPADFMRKDGQLPSFESRYNRLTEALTSDEAEYIVTYFLQGVSFDQDRIELEPDLVIERLNPTEIGQALDDDIIKPNYATYPIQPGEFVAFALRKAWRLPRITESEFRSGSQGEVSELTNPGRLSEELLQCLALLSGDAVYLAGTEIRRLDDDFSAIADLRLKQTMPVPAAKGGGFKVDESTIIEVKRLWMHIHNGSFFTNKALALAVRRLGFAAKRERAEDRLMDILIAAEAFYLTDAGDARERGELKYRLSLRAAVWSDESLEGWTRRQVLAHMRRAYDLRSVVAHGDEPRARDVKVKDVPVSLFEFIQATEEIIRAALKKAVDQAVCAGGRLSIPWDDLVLPDESSLPESGESCRATLS